MLCTNNLLLIFIPFVTVPYIKAETNILRVHSA